jgi:HisJ family histidinol phosphate phosphatase
MHIHTAASIDAINGNSFIDYMEAGEKAGVIPGFLDHFQAEHLAEEDYPFAPANVNGYLESYDRARETGLRSFLGLEVDYYAPTQEEWNQQTVAFMDDHRDQFDYFVGTVHDILGNKITLRDELERLLQQEDFDQVVADYFTILQAGIAARRFDGFAHLDVVYRFNGTGENALLARRDEYLSDPRTWQAMAACAWTGTAIELNLRGFDHPWQTTYPAEPAVTRFLQTFPGAIFFVGSDSHDVGTFERFAPLVRDYCGKLGSPVPDVIAAVDS